MPPSSRRHLQSQNIRNRRRRQIHESHFLEWYKTVHFQMAYHPIYCKPHYLRRQDILFHWFQTGLHMDNNKRAAVTKLNHNNQQDVFTTAAIGNVFDNGSSRDAEEDHRRRLRTALADPVGWLS